MLSETLTPAAEIANDGETVPRTASALERKLAHHADFSRAERDALDRLLGRDVRTLKGRSLLVEEGAAPTEISVILSGWACRYTHVPNGRRQIVAFYLPGDVCDFNVFMMTAFDQSIAAIDGARVAGIGRAALSELSKAHPRISRALWWESFAATAIQREWLINIGQRNAKQRVAHLLCELIRRLDAAGRDEGGICDVPLSQADIADACAMTAVHTNRTLQALRKMGLATLHHGRLTVPDRAALHDFAGFDPAYLQLGDPPRRQPSDSPLVTVAQQARPARTRRSEPGTSPKA